MIFDKYIYKGYIISSLGCISRVCIFDIACVTIHSLFFLSSSSSNCIRLFIVGLISNECVIVYATHDSKNFSSSIL